MVDEVIALDEKWVSLSYELAQLNKQLNSLSKDFKNAKVAGQSTDEITTKIKGIKEQIAKKTEEENAAQKERDAKLFTIGNLIPDEVPVSNDEEKNVVRAKYNDPKMKISEVKLPNHIQLFTRIAGTDCERGTKVAGGRGYYLCGPGALLNQALIAYGMQFLTKRGYIMMQTPYFMEKDMMAKCAQLADYDEQLYKVSGEGNDKYLIATSEQTLTSYFSGETVNFKAFNTKYANYRKMFESHYEEQVRDPNDYLYDYEPLTKEELENGVILFGGFSSCFRKETGKHGQDTLGIFRIHQFEKIEQLVICKPELSDRLHHFMINIAREFYQSLGISYRVVDIVSGALNDAAARKFDLEGWFPGSQCYRELVSCSNCLDYQSRNLDIKYCTTKDDSKKTDAKGKQTVTQREYVHMLNSTLTATERSLCAIVENWATEEGIVVPPVLRPFMLGLELIPYSVLAGEVEEVKKQQKK